MRRIILAAALAAAAPPTATAQFEGVANFKITTNTGRGQVIPGTGQIYVTRTAYRMEWETDVSAFGRERSGGSRSGAPEKVRMAMFGHVAEPDKLYMIDDANRTYSIWDLKKMRGEHQAPKLTYTVQKLGTETVAGLPCQKALLTSSTGDQVEVCVAKDFAVSAQWLAAMNRRQGDSNEWMKTLQENGLVGFPVRWAIRRKGAKEAAMTMELTRLERKTLPASLFEVPAGYRQTDYAIGGLSPEQEKAMREARERMREAMEDMTPEQRKRYEEMLKRHGAPPTPAP